MPSLRERSRSRNLAESLRTGTFMPRVHRQLDEALRESKRLRRESARLAPKPRSLCEWRRDGRCASPWCSLRTGTFMPSNRSWVRGAPTVGTSVHTSLSITHVERQSVEAFLEGCFPGEFAYVVCSVYCLNKVREIVQLIEPVGSIPARTIVAACEPPTF